MAEPRLCAAHDGQLVKGLGADHVVWGTDAVWTGAPQWQIEALRRLEIPEDMQKKYGFAAARPGRRPGQARDLRRELARRCTATTIKKAAWRDDRFAAHQDRTTSGAGRDPSNRRYGYVVPS